MFLSSILKRNRKPIETKSTNGETFIDIASGCKYISLNSNNTPLDLLTHNKNYVYACNQKICRYISNVPLHLYASTPNAKSLIINHKNITKELKQRFVKNNRIRTIKSLNNDVVEVEEHPVIELIEHPQENMSYSDWMSLIISYLNLLGNCLLEIIKEGEKIKYLNILEWERIKPWWDNRTGKIAYYNYDPVNATSRAIKPEQVIHLIDYDCGYFTVGKSKLEACLDSAVLYNYYDAYSTTLAANYGMPGVNINVMDKVANKGEAEKLAQEFIRKYSRNNNGKPIVTFASDSVDIKQLNVTPKDMEYATARKFAVKTICAAFGVPEDLINVENSNRASSITALNQFYSITIFPSLDKILEQINTKVVELYDDNIFLSYDPQEVISSDPKLQSEVLIAYTGAGIMNINEAREILELEPLIELDKEIEPDSVISPDKEKYE